MLFNDLIHNYSYNQITNTLLLLYPKEQIFINEGKYQNLYNYLLTLTPISHDATIKILTNTDIDDNSNRYYAVGQFLNNTIQQSQINPTNKYLEMEFAKLEDWLGCQYILDICNEKELICHVLYEISYLGYNISDINQGLINVKNYMSSNEYTLHDIEQELDFADGK